ncbi:MAG: IS110 family transposase [Thermoanaerobaculia bacterium]
MGRVIGLDVSKHSAEVAVLHPGRSSVERSRFAARPEAIRSFAEKLGPDDRVALESCTNAVAFHRLLCQHAGEVVVSNPLKTRVIAEAKVKTDKVDAEILARLLAADFLPAVWVPDPATDHLRHLVFHRLGLVTQRTQAKNRVHAILSRNLVTTELTDLFGKSGRRFLSRAELPPGERCLLDADLRVIDFLDQEIFQTNKVLAELVYEDADIRLLLTVPGLSMISAVGLKAAIGDIRRFSASRKLVSYFGLNPSVYQTGLKAYSGHISRRGRSHARSVCVEVAHQLVKAPGPFHAYFVRLYRRKPYNVAITAVARKLVVLTWHMLTRGEAYRYMPPALTRRKLAEMHRLATGESVPRTPGRRAPKRAEDKKEGLEAEAQYQAFISDRFGAQGPKGIDHPNRTEPSGRKQKKRT